ncbi:hypothetical protein, partial [Rhizobium sp. 18055]|uniref:hypothetical protein n=1 Tax=Rhizobium sp. 18055 TaxID=2681403 RepID=UPI00190F79B1
INIDQCSFTNNTTSNYSGGAVNISYYSYSGLTFPITGSASITNCSFTGNSAKNSGGAIYIDAQKNHNNAISFNTVIQNNTFTGNSTTTLDDPTSGRGRGGAIYIDTDFPAVVNYNYFSNNTTVSYPKNALFVSQGYTWGGGATV